MIFDDFFSLFSVASHTRSKGDTGIRNEEWWEMLKKVSNIVSRPFFHFFVPFFPAQGRRPFWDTFAHKTGWVLLELLCATVLVILLQVVMVSPGTHLVKNRECQSWPNESQLKINWNQTVNPKTDSNALYYSILKLKYSPSILKHNKG